MKEELKDILLNEWVEDHDYERGYDHGYDDKTNEIKAKALSLGLEVKE